MVTNDYFIGLISGTSVDGIDCALVEFTDNKPRLVATHFVTIDHALREKILKLCEGTEIDLKMYGQVDVEIGRRFATAANELLENESITAATIKAIGSHGQTVYHQPVGEFPFTLQLGDPNTIAQHTGITTVADFRRRDMTVGGEGAPLAPLMHRNCFQSATEDRVVINIGGISNITVLNKDGQCAAFDTGPGNVLMDFWIDKCKQQTIDNDGDWARTGEVNQELLELLLQEEYFSLPHPKSTGRELFNGHWLENKLNAIEEDVSGADVQATLLQLTVSTIVAEIQRSAAPAKVYVCGGGVHNSVLMEKLQQTLSDCTVNSTSALGVDPDWVEAIAFAWMAKQTIEGRASDTSAFTGASQATILGGIYQA